MLNHHTHPPDIHNTGKTNAFDTSMPSPSLRRTKTPPSKPFLNLDRCWYWPLVYLNLHHERILGKRLSCRGWCELWQIIVVRILNWNIFSCDQLVFVLFPKIFITPILIAHTAQVWATSIQRARTSKFACVRWPLRFPPLHRLLNYDYDISSFSKRQ